MKKIAMLIYLSQRNFKRSKKEQPEPLLILHPAGVFDDGKRNRKKEV
jgi:hypothetical protein